jgi:hypothetical protein
MARRVPWLPLFALAIGAVACGRTAAPPLTMPEPSPVARTAPDSNVARVFHLGRSTGQSRREIHAKLGDPRSMRADTVPNRHGPGLDSLFRLDYGTHVFWVRRPANADHELLELVEIFESNRRLPGGIVVNKTTFEQLRARLGQPIEGRKRGDTLMVTYRAPGDGADEFIRFDLVKEIVRRVVWIFYID